MEQRSGLALCKAKCGAPHAACIVSALPLEWYETYARRICMPCTSIPGDWCGTRANAVVLQALCRCCPSWVYSSRPVRSVGHSRGCKWIDTSTAFSSSCRHTARVVDKADIARSDVFMSAFIPYGSRPNAHAARRGSAAATRTARRQPCG